MPSVMVHQNVAEGEKVWHIEASTGLVAAQIWNNRAIKVEWQDDGTIETIPPRTRCLLAGNPAVDLTTLDYYIVVGKGAAATPILAPITAIGTFDTLIPAQPWGILRVVGKWDSAPYWPGGDVSGLPQPLIDGTLLYVDPTTHQAVWIQGTQGDTLRYENNIWERLPIGNLGDLYHVAQGPHGLRPEWVSLNIVASQLPPTGVQSSGTIPVTNPAGTTISGLIPDLAYTIQTTGGPWDPWGSGGFSYSWDLSNDGGASWQTVFILSRFGSDPQSGPSFSFPPWCNSGVLLDGLHGKVSFVATTTSVKIRVPDSVYADNTGTLGWELIGLS